MVVQKEKSELEDFKPHPTMDEILEAKLHPLIESINSHVENIYKDFNTALHKQHMNLVTTEKDLSQMNTVLWGIVNKSNVRLAALEKILIKNGLDKGEFAKEIEELEGELEKGGAWKNLNLNDVAKNIGLELSKGQSDLVGQVPG